MDRKTLQQGLDNLQMEYMFSTSSLNNIVLDANEQSIVDVLEMNSVDTRNDSKQNNTIIEDETSKIKYLECCSDTDNSRLINAVYETYRSKRLTPLLKYELKCLIQARRVTQGMEEMEVQFLNPTVQQLSAVEQEQVDRRRHQNRLAARRFRQKRKMSEEILLQSIQHLQEEHKQLLTTVQVLRKEKQLLMDTVTDHLLHCPCLSQLQTETPGEANVS